MAAVSCVLSEDEIHCPICLEIFTDPVSTSCGHSFCKRCINQHWNKSSILHCPVCKQHFSSRPDLKTNIVMSQMITQFKTTRRKKKVTGLKRQALGVNDVPCDLCSEPRSKAQKSCLLCLASYCQDHLQSHVSNPRLQRHQLVDATQNLDERICLDHNAPIDMFCRKESKLICLQCFAEEHKDHIAVPLKVQRETIKGELKELILKRKQKIQEIQNSVELSQQHANKEIEDAVKVFNALVAKAQQSLQSFKKNTEEIHQKTEKEATKQIQKLKQELIDLEHKETEMEEMSSSQDHLHFVQKFCSIKSNLNDWSKVKVSATYGTLLDAVIKLQNVEFENECRKLYRAHLSRLQKCAVDVTLDGETAHRNLQVSQNMKEVTHTDKEASSVSVFSSLTDKSRFWSSPYVLGKQKFSSGQAYFEVLTLQSALAQLQTATSQETSDLSLVLEKT
ncbi:hypothetical protein WMY93_024723 [Mugilogobius chulae]|uniref:Uncharacterized protein n=1 Tax=Mugilogobius chulae TaxID=88201 RepID=A0AAW0N1E8_9GOBI